ncbi:hypothetical protein [Candidatus Amarobacter glycogenicus]|uniref:hypothetical protein n=1 Tax=Candidatus Amarobacter glycogenicus TaxID=3140699 RepID=UPI0031CC8624
MAVAIGTLGLGFGQREASAADKVVTLNPTSGIVGTVVTAELFNAPPDDFITVIFKIPGDPILTTGTTDANGYAKFTFTIPYVPGGGTWPCSSPISSAPARLRRTSPSSTAVRHRSPRPHQLSHCPRAPL